MSVVPGRKISPPGYRSLAVGEYVIVYCVENEDVLIFRVVHGHRQLHALFGH